ncbi:MAG: DNA-3-methyladenine glycosylase family protein [Oscillospiraceae bacterium]
MFKLNNINDFDLKATFLSGQCFRWKEIDNNRFEGIVKNNIVTMFFEKDSLIIDGITNEEFDDFYKDYFDFQRDYNIIKENLSKDDVMKKAIGFSPNIKILNQEFWETLCSFIISQNNNIPRIISIIDKFCKEFGSDLGNGHYSFPSYETVKNLNLDQIDIIKSGFRGKYILDAAEKVFNKTVDINLVKTMNLDDSRTHLMQIKGVGPKVAECTLLYGAKKLDAFPIDVWMKRALQHLYPNGVPDVVKDNAGIAQLYIFNYARLCEDLF